MDNSNLGATNISQLAFDFLARHWKPIVAVIVLIIAYATFSRYSFIYISVDSPLDNNDNITVIATTDSEDIESEGAGLKVLPNDVMSVTVSQGDYLATSKALKVPFYRFVNLAIDLKYSKNASALAYENLSNTDCSTYNSNLKSLLSYNCLNPVALQSYTEQESGAWINKTVSKTNGSSNLDKTKPYMGGLLTINPSVEYSSRDALIVHPGSGDESTDLPKPKGLTNAQMVTSAITTNRYNPTDRNFVVIGSDKIAYFGNFNGGNLNYHTIAPLEDLDEWHDKPSCNITEKIVVCYYKARNTGDHSDYSTPTEYISVYDIATDKTVTKSLANEMSFERIYVTTNGDIYGRMFRNLYSLEEESNKYTAKILDTTVTAAGAGESIYYIKNNRVYKYNKSSMQSELEFYSKNIAPSSIIVQDKVYILGHDKARSTSMYAYELTSEDYTTLEPRIVDLLPVVNDDSSITFEQQLVGNKLSILMHLTVNREDSSNPAIDKDEFNKTRDAIERQIEKTGVDTSKLEIVYNY